MKKRNKFYPSVTLALICLLLCNCTKDESPMPSPANSIPDSLRASGYVMNYCGGTPATGVQINYSLHCDGYLGFCSHPAVMQFTNADGHYSFQPDSLQDVYGCGLNSPDFGAFYPGTDFTYEYVYTYKYYFPETLVVYPYVTQGIYFYSDSSLVMGYVTSVSSHAINPQHGEQKNIGTQISETTTFNPSPNPFVYLTFRFYGGIKNQIDITFMRNGVTSVKTVVLDVGCNAIADPIIYF